MFLTLRYLNEFFDLHITQIFSLSTESPAPPQPLTKTLTIFFDLRSMVFLLPSQKANLLRWYFRVPFNNVYQIGIT